MGLLATLTIGTILLVLVLILLQFFFVILSLFLCGKIVDSINDEFSSAMRAFGWWFLVGIGFSLLSGLVGFVLEPFAVILMPILFIVVIVVNFIIVKKIYDLGIGKTFLFFILFIVFSTILTAVNFFLSTLILGFSLFGMMSATSSLSTTPPAITEPVVIEESGEAEEIVTEEAEEETERKKPKFPTLPVAEEEVEMPEIFDNPQASAYPPEEDEEPEVVLEEPIGDAPYDCKDSDKCFEEKFLTCTPALYGGNIYGTVIDWKIIKSGDICVIDMMMNQGFGDETSKCEFPIADILSKGLTMDSINDDSITEQYCSGTIVGQDKEYFAEQEGAFICDSDECVEEKFATCEYAVFFDDRIYYGKLQNDKIQVKPDGDECVFSDEDVTGGEFNLLCRFPTQLVLDIGKSLYEFLEEIGEEEAMQYCEEG